MTTLFTRARTAGMIALTLVIAAAGAYPAQAGRILSEQPGSGMSSSDDHRDCDSRREIKYAFQQYGLKHVDVSKTHDYYIYRVSGVLPVEAELIRQDSLDSGEHLLKKKDHDYTRYVVLYDACEHEIIEQILPHDKKMGLPM